MRASRLAKDAVAYPINRGEAAGGASVHWVGSEVIDMGECKLDLMGTVTVSGRRPFFPSPANDAQCDISTGAVIVRRILRVTPPSTNSRMREWP